MHRVERPTLMHIPGIFLRDKQKTISFHTSVRALYQLGG